MAARGAILYWKLALAVEDLQHAGTWACIPRTQSILGAWVLAAVALSPMSLMCQPGQGRVPCSEQDVTWVKGNTWVFYAVKRSPSGWASSPVQPLGTWTRGRLQCSDSPIVLNHSAHLLRGGPGSLETTSFRDHFRMRLLVREHPLVAFLSLFCARALPACWNIWEKCGLVRSGRREGGEAIWAELSSKPAARPWAGAREAAGDSLDYWKTGWQLEAGSSHQEQEARLIRQAMTNSQGLRQWCTASAVLMSALATCQEPKGSATFAYKFTQDSSHIGRS